MSDVDGAAAPAVTDAGAAPPPTATEPADESLNLDDLPELDTAAPDEGAGLPEPVELEDFEEFDWEGKKVKGPKGLKDGVLRQADYTRKTQEVASERKALEAERQRIAEQAKASEEDLKLRATHIAKSEELEQYRKVDWDAWADQDPIASNKAFMRMQRLQAELSDIGQQINQRTQERTSEAQREFAKRIEETHEWAKKNVKGWTPETDRQVVEFATEQGIDPATLQSVMNPKIYNILHLARLGSQVLNKPAVPKLPSTPAPLETVTGKSNPPAKVSLESADMETYVALRKKQMAARG